MMDLRHNEDSRVKIPALLHFLRLGYTYQSKKGAYINDKNNIFIDIFKESIRKINNKDYDDKFLEDLIKEIDHLTDNTKDKGEHFFNRLVGYHKAKLIDLNNPEANDFRVVTELTFHNNNQGFRPDITILINGIPMGFVEVKKPNNQFGLKKEYDRMEYRLKNPNFTRFFNQFQVLGFSNNMPYNDKSRKKLQGSFYTTPNFEKTHYNNFREEKEIAINEYIDPNVMDYILSDNNLMSIKGTEEFQTNLKPDTYTNSFITSIYSKKRSIFFIRYGIVYVDSARDGFHKHIIRYPQYFAIQELIPRLINGFQRGVVWHTQGSGKTALAYFLTNVLRDFYQQMGVITKFYFVVDRLDLLIQASDEFSYRRMTIANINSKKDFTENIKSPVIVPDSASEGQYKETMNVVNIQKFSEDSKVKIDPKKNIQRIYFLDEVHRGYKPKGTFLANLLGSDPDGIFIGLTGTPLLKSDFKTTDIFSDGYIHKYYYNKSIADGYTLKIKKENIATRFKTDIRKILKIEEGEKILAEDWKVVTKSEEFVNKLCQYVIEDYEQFKSNPGINDPSLGSMIVTSSSEQAKAIKCWFDENSNFKSALVLYDEDNNKDNQDDFRGKKNKETGEIESTYHGVVVYAMLLTGFDAPRLKRLYLLREIKDHSLLQTLARVNRPYKNMKYGYVVDFVDITEQYEETNKRYLKELRRDIADEDDTTDVEDMFVDVEKILGQITELERKLFKYMGNIETNLEEFRNQIAPLDEKTLREVKSQLDEYKECYNELRMSHEDTSNIPIERLKLAYTEVSNRVNLKVAERVLEDPKADVEDIDLTQLIIEFVKTGEMDLEFSGDEILEQIDKVKNAFSANNDSNDPEYKVLNKRFKGLIKDFKQDGDSSDKAKTFMAELKTLYNEIMLLNVNNTSLINRYKGDDSCMRIHKRLRENYSEDLDDIKVLAIMNEIITVIDDNIKNLGLPSEAVIKMRLRKPIRDALVRQGIKSVSKRMADNIAMLFVDDKFNP